MQTYCINKRTGFAACIFFLLATACTQSMPPKENLQPLVSTGDEVSLEYTLKLKDQQVVDSNVGKKPLTYRQGEKKIIAGLEKAVEGMQKGETKQIVVAAKDGYGAVNADGFQEVPKQNIPKKFQVVGARLQGTDPSGRTVRPSVHEVHDDTIILDFNHPLAGKELFIEVKVLDIKKADSKT